MGNLATEALVNLADGEGVATGIDLHELLEVCHFLEGLLKQKLPSRLFQAISH
jgi:isopropylmalate/homocitrate/citramalate synthase